MRYLLRSLAWWPLVAFAVAVAAVALLLNLSTAGPVRPLPSTTSSTTTLPPSTTAPRPVVIVVPAPAATTTTTEPPVTCLKRKCHKRQESL